MDIKTELYKKLCSILTINYNLIDEKENKKINKVVSVLHKDYLISASKEARAIINKKDIANKYNLMITIYNRKIKEHQALSLLIQLFEIAMRTQVAIILSNKFSTPNSDDWYWLTADGKHQKLIDRVSNRARTISKIITPNMTTFDMFHMLTMNDVKVLYESHWEGDCKELFNNTSYKGNTIIPLTTKEMFLSRFKRINKYRNELYHGNPGTSSWRHIINDIENILVHLGYNIEEAINNIDPNHSIISLRYKYNN